MPCVFACLSAGSCPEVKASDPPMAVGTWLDLKGIHVSVGSRPAG